MSAVVLDACVALKWLFDDEEHVEETLAVRDRHLSDPAGYRLLAPTVWRYEIANGIWVAAKRGRLSKVEARACLSDVMAIGVELIDPPSSLVLMISLDLGVSACDAAYLATSEENGYPLRTADRRFLDSLPAGRYDVRWIGEFRA